MILKRNIQLLLVIGILMLMAGCTTEKQIDKQSQTQINLVKNKAAVKMTPVGQQQISQIHGIGYPGNDSALYIATNDGIKLYKGSRWLETSSNRHNYMSFQAVKDGFLASGHPEKKTGIKDPLGLVESLDQGRSIKNLAFYGISNFHFLSAGYWDKEIYVIQEQHNEKLDAGVYYSVDGGRHWEKSELNNFHADSLGMISVHPQYGDIMAIATRTGIYYSKDNGNTMKRITAPVMITAQAFFGDGILYSSVENKNILLKTINPKTGKQLSVVFPFLDYDNPITYLAVDPKNQKNIAFTTYKNDLYESTDGGKSWKSLFQNGKIEQE